MIKLPLRFLFLFATLALARAADEDANLKYFRDLAETRNYSLGRPVSPQPAPGGSAVIFLRGGPRDRTLRLYEFDLATRRERELITPAQLIGAVEEILSPEENI